MVVDAHGVDRGGGVPSPATARTTSKAERTPPHTQALGARVRLPIDLFEAFDAGVRVDLRGADAGVTE